MENRSKLVLVGVVVVVAAVLYLLAVAGFGLGRDEAAARLRPAQTMTEPR